MDIEQVRPLPVVVDVRAFQAASRQGPRVATDAIVSSISPSAKLLGRLRELADTAPQTFRDLMVESQKQIQVGVAQEAFEDPERLLKIAAAFQEIGQSKTVAKLDPSVFGNTVTPDQAKLMTALLARVDSALGIAAPPFGPWFPR